MFLLDQLERIRGRMRAATGAWLAPNGHACPVCGRPHHGGSSSFTGLCAVCTGLIPWITHIVCPVCGRPEACSDCRRRTDTYFIASRSAVRYDETIREWLAQYKYRGNESLLPLLGGLLCRAYDRLLREHSERQAGFGFDAVLPVPVSAERRMERGFNQAEQLASSISGHARIPIVHGLIRTRHSDKQSYKSRLSRIRDTKELFAGDRQVLHAFLQHWLAIRLNEAPLRLLLIDDIYTTGGTVNGCAEAVAASVQLIAPGLPFELYVLTLARS